MKCGPYHIFIKNMIEKNTIAAIATSSKNGSISIIRISGEEALVCASKIFFSAGGESIDLTNCQTHTIHYGFICDDKGKTVDEAIVLIMKAPRSYTAEDVVEIQCHGGYLICQMVLQLLIQAGARVAEPGEFTKRAFLNGRIDLSQAEAVMDVIQSENKIALGNSVSQLRGNIKEKIKNLREILLTDIAFLEAGLDDPEHISLDEFSGTLSSHVEILQKEVSSLLEKSGNGRIIKEGIRTVIVGRPNVGKSSFMNCMLREDRAIVTDVPGTTRDTLEEELQIGLAAFRLIDTAGIHETEDVVESIGIEKTKKAIEQADFVLCILDASSQITEEDRQILKLCTDKQGIILLNKSDMESRIKEEDIYSVCRKKILHISAATGDGIDELEQEITSLFISGDIDYNKEIYITNARQKQALLDTKESLSRLEESIQSGMPEDFYSIDMTDAYEHLGKIIGETVEDDIIDKIFHDFCMGK